MTNLEQGFHIVLKDRGKDLPKRLTASYSPSLPEVYAYSQQCDTYQGPYSQPASLLSYLLFSPWVDHFLIPFKSYMGS